MNKYNRIDGRSLTVGCDGSSRAQTPPTAILSQFLKSPPRGRRLAGPPPPSGQMRAGPETWAQRGPGKPRTPPARRRGGACSPEPPPSRPPTYLGVVGEGKCQESKPRPVRHPPLKGAARGRLETVTAATSSDTERRFGGSAQRARMRHTPPAVSGSLRALRPRCRCIGSRPRHSRPTLPLIGQRGF